MSDTFLNELLKSGITVAILAIAVWVLWKLIVKTTAENKVENLAEFKELKTELRELRSKYENELLSDRVELKVLVSESVNQKKELTQALTRFEQGMNRFEKVIEGLQKKSDHVMQCLTDEIKVVKPILQNIQKNLK